MKRTRTITKRNRATRTTAEIEALIKEVGPLGAVTEEEVNAILDENRAWSPRQQVIALRMSEVLGVDPPWRIVKAKRSAS